MRKQYWDILSQKLREGGFSWIAGAGTSVVGTWLSSRVSRPLVGPSIGTLIITYRCNYFCEFCELPARAVRRKKEGITEFTPEEMFEAPAESARHAHPLTSWLRRLAAPAPPHWAIVRQAS